MKLNCIIDTCSCIYLSYAEFQQSTLLRHLHNVANLNYSKEVYLEIQDHKDKGLPAFIQNQRLILKTLKYSMDDYEMRMLARVLPSRKKKGSKGEIDNFLLTIDQLHHMKKGAVVFITDDETAINGILQAWLPSFPALKLWSSYEVVLYLYAEKVIPSKDIAVEMIKDLIATTAPKISDRSENTTKKLTAQLKTYNHRIENISKTLN